MRKLKLFFACMLMAVLSIGQMWADDATDVVAMKGFAGLTASSYQNQTKTGESENGIDMVAYGFNANTGQVRGNKTTIAGASVTSDDANKNWSLYNSEAMPGAISKIEVTQTATGTNKFQNTLYVSLGTASQGDVTVITSAQAQDNTSDGQKITFTIDATKNYKFFKLLSTAKFTSGSVADVKVTITYDDGQGGGGGSTPSLSVAPTSIDFGTVEKGTPVSSEAVAVTFANLTGSVAYSGLSSPFTASGTVSATGDEITIAANTSNVGEYEQTLTIQSTADALSKTVTVTMNVVEPFDGLELTFPDEGTDGYNVAGYTVSWTATKNSHNWAIYGFNTNKWGWSAIKTGRKSNSGTAQPLTATIATQVTGHAIGDIVVTVDAVTAAQVTSHKLYVADNADYNNAIEIDGNPATIASGNITYSVPVANRANDLYYKLVYETAGTASSNGILTISKITYAYAAATPQKPSAGLAFDAAQKLAKLGAAFTTPTFSTAEGFDGTVTYESDNTDVATIDASTGTVTIVAAGKAVITAHSDATENFKEGSASYTIFVAEQAGTSEDPLTEASAKALIDLGCTLTAHVNGIIATATYNSTYHNYSVNLTNGVQFFRLKDLNNADFSSDYLDAGDEVTAVGQLTKYNTTYELAEGCYLTFYEAATTPLTPIANDEATAYTVEQALIYAAAPTTYDLSDIVYVRGKVAIASTALFNNKYLTYSISDDGSTTNVLKIYNGLGIDGAAFESKDDILVGDVVVVKGNLTQHNTELELAANNELVSKKPVATIAIENMELEYEEVATISATITPAAAASTVVYNIKAGSDDVITLAGDEITAKSVTGTATIVATIASTDDYEGVTKEFTVSVSEGDTRKKATLTSFAIGGVFDVTDMIYAAYQGDAANPVYISGTGDEMRLYKPGTGKTTGGYIVINAVKGCTIDEVIVYNGSAKATTIGCSTTSTLATSGEAYAKSASVSFKNLDATVVYIDNIGSDRMDIKKIEVFYTGDAAAVDHYELGGTYQTEFEIDDEFNHDGLVVYMAYDAGGTEKLEITPACTFSEPDMSVAGTPTVNITFAGGVVKTYDITVAASTLLDPELSYDPTSVTLTQGDALSAPTLNNPHTLDLTFNSNKTSVATVDEFGVIALAGGTGTATITASFAGDATYLEGDAVYTITVNEAGDDLSGTWTLASSVAAGDKIIIANVAVAGELLTMGAQNGSYREQVASTVDGENKLTPAAGTKVFTLVDASSFGSYEGFALQASNGNYLSSASNSSNNIKEVASVSDANAVWSIVISEGVAAIVAQGSYARKVIRYNSVSTRFSCYAESNTMADVVIYKHGAAPEPPTPSYTEVRSGLTAGNYYTICYPKAMTDVQGATLWSFVGKDANFAYIEQETATTIEAGKPYIMYATASTVTAVLGTDVASAGVNGAIHGTLDPMDQTALNTAATDAGKDLYLVIGNELRRATGTSTGSNTLPAQRAFVVLGDIPAAPAHMPAHVRAMPMHKDAATGLDALNASDKPVKMVINGQLFILRGEKMYDATGKLVK